jgi:glutathione S-transferase
MALELHFHPLSSFSQKALVALYENDTPFTPKVLDVGDPAQDAAFRALWPIRKFPVLRDTARNELLPEASIIIEYLDRHYPGKTRFIPADPDAARKMRFMDRIFDLYVNVPMQKIVTDKIRPAGKSDPFGVDEARKMLGSALSVLDRELAGKTWAIGDAFTMADCAAASPLFYANKVMPFGATHRNVAAYFERLLQRPSYGRSLAESQPYLKFFPG